MALQGLKGFIVHYIEARRQTKLDAFDKEAAKRLTTDAASESEILQQRRELEQRYEVRNWLTDAASRAGQISLVTHAAKFTHGDAKSSSIFTQNSVTEGYLATSTLHKTVADAVGNAAALDVAKLLQTEVEGDSLLSCLKRKEPGPLSELAENPQQLAEWIDGFSRALTTREPASHKLAKQVYFPVGDGYHLLNPLFSSSLAQALHQRMVALRFSEESKAAWQARRAGQWHPQPLVIFPKTAVMNFGGTKPQNISALNSSRGGRVWLLSCQAPQWETQKQPPYNRKTLFGQGPFERTTRALRSQLINLLIKTGEERNHSIRRARDRYIDQIIDVLFSQAADIQRKEWAAWTQNEACQLKPHQQLWLDPWRIKSDAVFCAERDKDEWQEAIAEDFAQWLNGYLRRADLSVGKTELTEWKTKPLFRRRLREMEQVFRRYHDE
ncbi:type I-F CRISPR-associated protein Csy1 [Paramixta manurensis]|uniref:Type I-F CRISPR-associated protein Csy1 n=1 Tax=Paramixta manurensis TaxID=2740817 RepID=A0A6M8U5D6_9GAMM|nr:type I-F CRISPR-associated protein Csy1 [Erwiniaceae bacterium PD-1]